MTESESGSGKVFKGREFIAEVRYKIQIKQHYRKVDSMEGAGLIPDYQFSPVDAITAQFGTEPLTLHMNDGMKPELFGGVIEGPI